MAHWLYLLSDERGSWPVLKDEPLPPGILLAGGRVLAELFGRYDDQESAMNALKKLEAMTQAAARTPIETPAVD
jgi:hypothetical protein